MNSAKYLIAGRCRWRTSSTNREFLALQMWQSDRSLESSKRLPRLTERNLEDMMRPMSSASSNLTVPWITKNGSLDPAKFPIEGILQQAMDNDARNFQSGLRILGTMHQSGREEAGVFLLRLLVASDDSWDRRLAIIEALRDVQTEACARLLFTEIRRVKSSNTTRRYLDGIIKTLTAMRGELVELVGEEFCSLADDPSFSHRMRSKFRAAATCGGDIPSEWF